MLQVVKEIIAKRNVEQIQISHQEDVSECVKEQNIDEPVPRILQESLEGMRLVPHEQLQRRSVQNRSKEQIVDMPALQFQQKVVEVINSVYQCAPFNRSSRLAFWKRSVTW